MRIATPRDPLLAATKSATIAMKVALGVGMAAVVAALPMLLLNQDVVAAEIAKEGKDITIGSFVTAASILLPLVAGLLAMAFWFVHLLGRIIDTVGEGDPFIPANADRLRTMAWISLAIQVAMFAIAGAAARIIVALEDAPSDSNIGIDLTGLVLVLILFVLARVFRKGAEMREELEGTV